MDKGKKKDDKAKEKVPIIKISKHLREDIYEAFKVFQQIMLLNQEKGYEKRKRKSTFCH